MFFALHVLFLKEILSYDLKIIHFRTLRMGGAVTPGMRRGGLLPAGVKGKGACAGRADFAVGRMAEMPEDAGLKSATIRRPPNLFFSGAHPAGASPVKKSPCGWDSFSGGIDVSACEKDAGTTVQGQY